MTIIDTKTGKKMHAVSIGLSPDQVDDLMTYLRFLSTRCGARAARIVSEVHKVDPEEVRFVLSSDPKAWLN